MALTPPAERLVRQRGAALMRRLAAARAGDVEGVHQARVATRRLREALPLLPPGGRRRRLVNAVRKLTRALGPVRELDVSLEGLRELVLAHPQWQAALNCAREMLIEDRRAAILVAMKRIDRWEPARIRKAAQQAGTGTAPGAVRQSRGERLGLLRRRAARRAGLLQSAIDHAASVYLPDRLHVVRIAVKKLRYLLETSQELAGRPVSVKASRTPSARSVAGRIAILRQAQDLLGRLHDHEMLIHRLRAAQGALEESRHEHARHLEAAVRLLETECRQLHAQYMALRPRLMDVASRVAAAASQSS